MASHSAVTVLERQEKINELDFGYIIGEVRHVRISLGGGEFDGSAFPSHSTP